MRVDTHSHHIIGDIISGSYSVNCHYWPAKGMELTEQMRSDARHMLSMAIELKAKYVAYQDDGRKIVLEIDGQVGNEVERRMKYGPRED